MKAWEISGPEGGIGALHLAERPDPEPGPGEVAVAITASALNFRDLATVEAPDGRVARYPLIPNSDGAGEVVAVGEGVETLAPGIRVTSAFFKNWIDGAISAPIMAGALGGASNDGVLAETIVLPATAVVRAPAHLSDAEAATLPCAALTAWHALVEKGRVMAGETVLVLGTGGVSIFALQFAAMHGARCIVTSSSDAKLERARDLGAEGTINYRSTPDWDRAVLDLTGGAGADHVIEVGGPGTLERSANAVRIGGRISLIGILTGAAGQASPTTLMRKSVTLQGIYVGSRAMFERMNRAVETHQLKPVIDSSFAFDRAPEAFACMKAAGHFGKIVVER
ncbi:MAG: NAD(P)-dependent alcohol dehydrogenase [Rhodospirillaceae bacterium]|jgi:NADPH:quinone reductase-like Zn-dependent oxidoreductase|nr:NAD(P)-dependent alcohol dehydrogenase [Rhodospirillaceae bacterium]MBT6117484.1 NAD(P)-dependent alcohol dehydrogenase [Rhodospirillaceae bacterium]